MKLKTLFIGFAALGLVYLFVTSCKKNTDCVATIYCVDSVGVGMPNIDVLLYAKVKTPIGGTITADVKASGVTDGSGMVSFTFKLPAIYDISATKGAGSTGSLSGVSIIKLEEGKKVEKTVTVR